ncbi:fimbrial outer membrane usher protein [Klebsiella oxytoca]|uniref:fimbrial outer membrane usher protein n=1 Tax=Klebsiella oxytoca TaxID=571 RepID=UPI0011582DE1|nr:fimbrial outer membrane usher protein [Klebsiella oxytoca]
MRNTVYKKNGCGHHSTRAYLNNILLTASVVTICSPSVSAQDFYFDPALLKGSALGQDMERFNHKSVAVQSGEYVLDVYVNNVLVAASETIAVMENADGRTEPCLTDDVINKSSIRKAGLPESDGHRCTPASDTGTGVLAEVDLSQSRLNLSVPQSGLLRNPRGFIPVESWDSGEMALFLRHNTNFTRTENTGSGFRYNYLWSNVNTGTNLGLWQLRHTGNLRYADSNIAGSNYKYNAARTWGQRAVPGLESVLTVGDSYTSNSLFGSLSFNGIKLATDTRMWPQGKRGYAPEVRGVAATTARVVIRQQGRIVYETTVSPGSFVINDLFNTKSQGDLHVEVIEAGGNISTFTVPYSSVPDSVRPGNWEYSLSLGRVRNYYSVNNRFIEGTLQRGMSNMLTANSGLRFADDYQAALLGGVVATELGAFGLNTTFSHARVENGQSESGWRAEASYSRTFDSGTNLVLAAYRYSTSGFRDLQDVLGVRRQSRGGAEYWSDTLRQRNKFSATISQPMNEWGMLNLSGSTADYYGGKGQVRQLQLGYSNNWKQLSYNLSIARQQTVLTNSRYYYSLSDNDYDTSNRPRYTENTISLGFSVPLNFGNSRSNLTFGLNKNRDTRSAQTGINGSVGEQGNVTYSLYGGAENYRNSGNATTWGGNVQQNTPVGAVRASMSAGKNYRQFGAGYSGTLVAHRGGVTAGPYASDTFAIVHAPGASGAIVKNGQGATIDRFGYAIHPSLTPYQYNNIGLDSRFIDADVELQGGSKKVVPYAGAMPVVNFETRYGRAVLITTQADGEIPPMGADVFDSRGNAIGMVGQGGQIYARVEENTGKLSVKWGPQAGQICDINYRLSNTDKQPVTQITLPCVRRK